MAAFSNSPQSDEFAEFDGSFILFPKLLKGSTKSAKIRPGIDVESYHSLVLGEMKMRFKRALVFRSKHRGCMKSAEEDVESRKLNGRKRGMTKERLGERGKN